MTGEDVKDRQRVSWLVPCVMGSLPVLMSCKSRAEAFARHLQTKLKSLGGLIPDDDTNGYPEEEQVSSTDIIHHEQMKPKEQHQPVRDDEELYYDFDFASSSGSPSSPDPSSHSHDSCVTQPFPATQNKMTLTNEERDESVLTPTNINSESTNDDRDSACDAGSEHETNPDVLDQGQSNYGTETNNDKHSSTNFVTLSISAMKLDDGPDESIDGQQSTARDENNEENEHLTNNELLESPVWGSLKLIDRFKVRKEEHKDQDQEENNVDMPDCESSPRESRKNYFYGEEVVGEDDSTEDLRPKHIYRSSSLKTGKTPPGTPGRKKIVRFADVLGLDLEDVKHVCLDDLPTVPKSAYSDLDESAMDQQLDKPFTTSVDKPEISLMAMFNQPYTSTNFLERVRTQKVCLESAVAVDGSIKGQARVLNLEFNKKVFVRYTTNEWRSFVELETNYLVGSYDGLTDRFTFVIFGGDKLNLGQRIIFCLRYVTLGQEFWDNNLGQNYQFQCIQDCPTPALNMALCFDDDNTSFLF